ncbi:hypothetical protein RI367_001388 [Sorochytrium milnesiophthora]
MDQDTLVAAAQLPLPPSPPLSPSTAAATRTKNVRRYSRDVLLAFRSDAHKPASLHVLPRRPLPLSLQPQPPSAPHSALASPITPTFVNSPPSSSASAQQSRRRSMTAIQIPPGELAKEIGRLSHELSSQGKHHQQQQPLGRRASVGASTVLSASKLSNAPPMPPLPPSLPRERTKSLGGGSLGLGALAPAPALPPVPTGVVPVNDVDILVQLTPVSPDSADHHHRRDSTFSTSSHFSAADDASGAAYNNISRRASMMSNTSNHNQLDDHVMPLIPIPEGLPGNSKRRLRAATAPHSTPGVFAALSTSRNNPLRARAGLPPIESEAGDAEQQQQQQLLSNSGLDDDLQGGADVHLAPVRSRTSTGASGRSKEELLSTAAANTVASSAAAATALGGLASPSRLTASPMMQSPSPAADNLLKPGIAQSPRTAAGSYTRSSTSSSGRARRPTPLSSTNSPAHMVVAPTLSPQAVVYPAGMAVPVSPYSAAHMPHSPHAPIMPQSPTHANYSTSLPEEVGYVQQLSESPRNGKHRRAKVQAVRVPDQTEALVACFTMNGVSESLHAYLRWLPFLSYTVRLHFIKQMLILGTVYKQFSTMLQVMLHALDERAFTPSDICDALEDVAFDLDHLSSVYPDLRVLYSNVIVALVRRELLDREQLYRLVEKTRLTDAECSYELAGLLLKRLKAQWPEDKFLAFFTNELQLQQFLPPDQQAHVNERDLIQQFQVFVDVPSLEKLVARPALSY